MGCVQIASLVDQKKEADEPQVALAKQIIAKVGEFGSVEGVEEIVSNISQLATILVDVGDLKIFPNEIAEIFVLCMSSLPVQSTVVATVLSLVFKREANFAVIVCDRLEAKFLQALSANDILQAKIILRSMAALMCCKCLSAESFSATLGVLCDKIESSLKAFKQNGSQAKGRGNKGKKTGTAAEEAYSSVTTILLYLIASTLPWAQEYLDEAIKKRCGAIFTYFLSTYVSPYDVDGVQAIFQVYACPLDEDGNETTPDALGALSAEGPESSACWDTLWESVYFANAVCSEGRELPESMLRPWVSLVESLNEEVSGTMWDGSERPLALQLSVQFGDDLASFEIDSLLETTSWLTPVFPLFDRDSSPGAAACGASLDFGDRLSIKNYFRDIVHFFDPVIGEDGTFTGTLQLMIQHIWAVSKHLSPEKKAAVLSVGGALPALLIETLVQLLLSSETRSAKISRLLLELCKSGGESHIQALGQGVNLLFGMVDELDLSASDKVASWLATHLVNTQLIWPYWPQWAAAIKEDNDGQVKGPRAYFCKSVVDSLGRRALPQKVFPSLMGVADFESCLQQEGEAEPVLFLSDDELFADVKQKIDLREESAQILEKLESHPNGAILLLQVILNISGCIPSAFTSLVERYGELLRVLPADITEGVSDEDEALVKSLSDSCSHDGGLFCSFLDISLRRAVLSTTATVNYLCSDVCLSKINDDIWVKRLAVTVVQRSLDIVRAALVQYLESGNPLPFDYATFSQQEQQEKEEQEQEEQGMQDGSREAYAAKALGAAVLGARRVHATLLTALMKHAAGDTQSIGVQTSLIASVCRIYKAAGVSCQQIANTAHLGFDITDSAQIASTMDKNIEQTPGVKVYERFVQ